MPESPSITREELAEKLHRDVKTIYRWETNGWFPRPNEYEQWMDHLGLRVENIEGAMVYKGALWLIRRDGIAVRLPATQMPEKTEKEEE